MISKLTFTELHPIVNFEVFVRQNGGISSHFQQSCHFQLSFTSEWYTVFLKEPIET